MSSSLHLDQMAIHNPLEVPAVLPERLALQIHWYREPSFLNFLRANEFRVIVIARHPLDILISVLHFIRREPLTARWLEGDVQIPPELARHSPVSPAFLEYATSRGAENLLSVSYQWWHEPAAIKVRYEQLVRESDSAFGNIVDELGQSRESIPMGIKANPFRALQETPNCHAWRATPGLWRQLISPLDAWRILRHHRKVFRTLDYSVPPYLLTRARALRNWQHLAI